ncbi:MAG: hypothetical protein AAF399_28770, partial [Bacteroidota bacterium]
MGFHALFANEQHHTHGQCHKDGGEELQIQHRQQLIEFRRVLGEDMNAGYAFSQYSAEFYELLPVLNLQFFTTVFVALAVGMMLFIRKESV